MYVDMDGVENVSVALVKHAKKDFIKGAKILYHTLKKIPTYKELIQDKPTLSNLQPVRWMYDSWTFVKKDPYNMFGDVGEESIIKQWKFDAITSYYKDLYLPGATILYKNKGNKEIYEIADGSVKKKIKDKSLTDDFIEARNYILNIPNYKEYLDDWNRIAKDRVNRLKKNPGGRSSIENTSYAKQRKAQRIKNINRAKELYSAGISKEAIAKEMMVSVSTVNNYLRS